MATKEEMLKEIRASIREMLTKDFMKEGRKQTWGEVREMLYDIKRNIREMEEDEQN